MLDNVTPTAINGYGNSVANSITGNDADNTLDGKAGNDILIGGVGVGDGDDTIIGGLGNDTLTGGVGSDVFVYKSLSETGKVGGWFDPTIAFGDTINDFTSNTDTIDISALPGTWTFETAHTRGNKNELVAVDDGTDTFLYLYADADIYFDAMITLLGVTVVAGDLIL